MSVSASCLAVKYHGNVGRYVGSGMRNDQDYHTKEKYLHADDCVVVRGKLFELVEIS